MERIKYYLSYVNETEKLKGKYNGYFELNNQGYTLSITDESYSTDKTDFNKIKRLSIKLSKNFFTYPSSYEEYLESAKKQPQPQLEIINYVRRGECRSYGG